VTTAHAVGTAAGELRYHATISEYVLTDTLGKPLATIFSTTYLRDAVADVSRRPVFFAFNGGPGASSTPLHLAALGPVNRAGTADAGGQRPITPNALTLLDAADLVFIDPVGTGLSRVLPGVDGSAFYAPVGDARAVLRFIAAWLDAHGRRGSPVYLCGESYGGYRLATMLRDVGSLDIAGIVLISPMLDATAIAESPGNDLPYIFALPAMAAAAWHHGRARTSARSVDVVFDRARTFAMGDYATALLQGTRLSSRKRALIAARMHALVGLPTSAILTANLRIETDSFVTALLRDTGVRIGRLDTRATGSAKDYAPRRPPMNDPSMTMTTGSANSLNEYFRTTLGAHTARDYVSLAMDVNALWNWNPDSTEDGFYHNATPSIGAAMRTHPRMRVLLMGGYYDLAAPILSARYALDHGGVPPERLTVSLQKGGHSMYETDATRAVFTQTIGSFIQAGQ
jgi:carboxypeptidase C (cathepsin A)